MCSILKVLSHLEVVIHTNTICYLPYNKTLTQLRSFTGVDFSNAVLDRVNFGKADLQGAVFRNTVLSGSTFDDAKLEGAVFEDTIIGYIDLQKICRNTTIGDEGRAELGCR